MGDDAALPFLERRMPVAPTCARSSRKSPTRRSTPLREGFVFDMRAWVGSGDTNGDVPALGLGASCSTRGARRDARSTICASTRGSCSSVIALELGDDTARERIARALRRSGERRPRRRDLSSSSTIAASRAPVPAILAAGAIHQRLTTSGPAHAGLDRRRRRLRARRALDRDRDRRRRERRHAVARAALRRAQRHAQRVPGHGAFRHDQDHGEARHLLAALVHRRADVRVARARPRRRRHVFPGDARARAGGRLLASSKKTSGPGPRLRPTATSRRTAGSSAIAATACGTRSIRSSLKTLRAAAMKGDEAAFLELSDRLEARAADQPARPDRAGRRSAGRSRSKKSSRRRTSYTRFATAAMSLGALAPEVHKTIAIAANRLGARSNSGEGGEEPRATRARRTRGAARSSRSPRGASASARPISPAPTRSRSRWRRARKPGEGGQIPGFKVSAEIAALRGAVAGQALISPPPHHDIYSIEDLARADLRSAPRRAARANRGQARQPSRASATSPAASPRPTPT